MGRKPGSKNIVDNAIKKLEKQGYKITAPGDQTPIKPIKKTGQPITPATVGLKAGETAGRIGGAGAFKLEVPPRPVITKPGEKPAAAQPGDKDTYKCGVKICGYEAKQPFEICPNCGTRNAW